DSYRILDLFIINMLTQNGNATTVVKTTVNINDFRNPQIPDRDGLVQSVKTALEHFDKCSDNNITDENFYRHIKDIMEQDRKFRSMTQDSVDHCEAMAAYATDFVEYMQILMEDNVSGGDFIGVMKSHTQSAIFNKS
ncbi:15851_t:CDS:2, partial [Acaulospora morrowiae]